MKKEHQFIMAIVANEKGEIFELEGFASVGMAGETMVALTDDITSPMPHGGELMLLPERFPVLYNIETGNFEMHEKNPYIEDEDIYPVAVFNSPGYVNTYLCAYEEEEDASLLPLFSYGAIGWIDGDFHSAVIQIDKEDRQDLRCMPEKIIHKNVKKIQKKMPDNRIRDHITNCALEYGCPAAKNFFLKRYEAPIPTSRHCNARCMGCLSLQENSDISNCQNRISFTPNSDEIYEIAIEHITNVKNSIVSFGQGCEGDPLMAADVIIPAINKIRSETDNGTINMNTNASKPDIIEKLFDAGLDSIRISMNSTRKKCYHAYFRPKGYTFEDVIKSIDIANQKDKFISINYLNLPGITDSPEEFEALLSLLKNNPVNFIQWRNLNYDPKKYMETISGISEAGEPMGMEAIINQLKKEFPDLKHGYFNPPKEKFI